MAEKRFIFRAIQLVFALMLMAQTGVFGQASAAKGKSLFKANCAACHNKNMKDDMTGPALCGVEERWADYPKSDLASWIHNSQKLIQSGHPRAIELWNKYKPITMTPFPSLTEEDIESILMHIKEVCEKGPATAAAGAAGSGGAPATKVDDSNLLYYILFGLFAILALILFNIVSSLDYVRQLEEEVPNPKKLSLMSGLKSTGFKRVVTFFLVVFLGHFLVKGAISLGRQQGYKPDQPINFSHKIHAGDNKIDCKFCHDGARRSRHSMIPDNATCMKCHKAIKVGSKDGTAELTKIYASQGFDPNTGEYIEGFKDMPMDEVAGIYKKWIGDNYMSENDLTSLDAAGESEVEKQWKNIVRSLTNEFKSHVYGPIEWVRVHNLPDHVFYSHRQHVEVGKLECQTCHGPIETMDKVYQYSPLSMGWCVNCHRNTEIQLDNPYYEDYELLHKKMKAGEKVTVADIGGTECQKCHY